MKQIIVCDDDLEIRESIAIYLKNEGYKTFLCANGEEAINCLNRNHIDLIIMDIMMPGLDGFETVKKIREESSVPVIFLSAKTEDSDKIDGLELGADDYMTKPFNPLLLKARVKSLLKRSTISEKKQEKKLYKFMDLSLDTTMKKATLGKKTIPLTPIEYKILLFIMKNSGKVLSANDIYKEVWNGNAAFNVENTIAVHIRHIRKKIEKDSRKPKYIKAVWGVGYKMEEIQ